MHLTRMLGALAAALLMSSSPVIAHPITFLGTLSNAGEPPEAAGSPGTGSVKVILDDDTFTLEVHASFSGLLGNSSAAHIHCCTSLAGVGNAGVATPVPSFPGFPLGVKSGTYDQSFDMTQASSWNPAFISANGGTTASAFAAFSTGINAGEAYFNIHSEVSPSGEIRAFLQAVPEPGSAVVLLGGLIFLVVIAQSRRCRRLRQAI